MLILHDRASFAHALTLDLDPPMRRALRRRIEGLSAGAHDLTDLTEIIVLQPGDTMADLAREADFRPGADPFGDDHQPAWDYLSLSDGVWDAVFTFGSTFALILLVPDDRAAAPELVDAFRQHHAQ